MDDVSRQDRPVMREDGQGPIGAGRGKRHGGCHGDFAICVGNGQLHQTELGGVAGALNCMHDQQIIISDGKPKRKYIVRRLTPLECCRLQGFPDWWEDGVGGSDSERYRLWGNGMALPNMLYVMEGIKEALDGNK